ncbi:MAG: hypothetical protein IPN22_00255 [Bacteroidetes bacterium]|nr:hypothetical protein [Bacteroidota bacterium]
MKLLVCVSQFKNIQPALQQLEVVLATSEVHRYVKTCSLYQHEVDILETGASELTTANSLTGLLSQKKYHLALLLSTGTAYKPEYIPGTVLNIVNDKPGDSGTIVDGQWLDYYDLGLMDKTSPPHIRGGFINLNNAYMNVFAPFKKVVGLTVNHFRNKHDWQLKQEKYKADCETSNGLGFSYTCLAEKQSYYHLTFIEHNMVSGNTDQSLALSAMNTQLISLLQKL